jgi:hypothetical protein
MLKPILNPCSIGTGIAIPRINRNSIDKTDVEIIHYSEWLKITLLEENWNRF